MKKKTKTTAARIPSTYSTSALITRYYRINVINTIAVLLMILNKMCYESDEIYKQAVDCLCGILEM